MQAAPGRVCQQLLGRRRTCGMAGTMERGRADYTTTYVARSSIYRALGLGRLRQRGPRLRRDTRHVTVLPAVLLGIPEATQLRHHNFAQPAVCGVVASRLMPDHVNRYRRQFERNG